jgi:hypothetical protein
MIVSTSVSWGKVVVVVADLSFLFFLSTVNPQCIHQKTHLSQSTNLTLHCSPLWNCLWHSQHLRHCLVYAWSVMHPHTRNQLSLNWVTTCVTNLQNTTQSTYFNYAVQWCATYSDETALWHSTFKFQRIRKACGKIYRFTWHITCQVSKYGIHCVFLLSDQPTYLFDQIIRQKQLQTHAQWKDRWINKLV